MTIASSIVVLCLIAASSASGQTPSWSQLRPLPDKIGFAGSLVGVSNGALIVGGGSNFPGKPVWEGGTKVWYDSAFVLDTPDGEWQAGFKLPRPLGYSVCISTTGGVYCIGGSDAERHYADTFKLTWRDGKLHHTPGPELPRPCANFCGAQVGNVIYVAGGLGAPNDSSTLKTFWSLDLTESLPKWKELEPWPGPARMLSTAAAIGDSFYLFSGVDLSAGTDGKPVRHYRTDAYRYTPGKGWKRLADLPRSSVAAPTPAAVTKSGRVLFLGGDDGSLVYLPQKEHPGFPDTTLAYDVARDAWSITGMTPHPMAVTPLVEWHGGWILAGGELRPGIRTPQVWRVAE